MKVEKAQLLQMALLKPHLKNFFKQLEIINGENITIHSLKKVELEMS